MILDKKSFKRFNKLYAAFINYANTRLGICDATFDRFDANAGEEAYHVARAVSDYGRNIHLVADYVRDNPDGLSRTDLKEIAQWENALAGVFTIQRDGRDMLFSVPPLHAGRARHHKGDRPHHL